MRKSPSTVGIAPGDGLIARFGSVVVYLAVETSSTDRILGAIEAVADTERPGAAIAQRLAAVVFGSSAEPPPFGVLAPAGDGTVILVRGTVVAEIHGPEGVRTLSGARAFTWVDEIVREPVRRITIGADTGSSLVVHPRTDLRSGVVPGGGFEFRAGRRQATKVIAPGRGTPSTGIDLAKPVETGASPAHTAPAGFEVLDAADAGVDPARAEDRPESDRRREPTATNHSSAALPRPGTDRSGPPHPVVSSPAHPAASSPAHPAASSPAHLPIPTHGWTPGSTPAQPRRVGGTGGESAAHPGTQAGPVQRPHTPARQPAVRPDIPADDSRTRPARPGAAEGSGPPVAHSASPAPGALVYDETAYPLDRPYVIGRSPETDQSVRTAAASPLTVPRDRHVSRIHAYVTVERGKVFVRDAGTPAGTFIAAPGAGSWTRIGTATTELSPGWSIRIGEKVLTYRPHD